MAEGEKGCPERVEVERGAVGSLLLIDTREKKRSSQRGGNQRLGILEIDRKVEASKGERESRRRRGVVGGRGQPKINRREGQPEEREGVWTERQLARGRKI